MFEEKLITCCSLCIDDGERQERPGGRSFFLQSFRWINTRIYNVPDWVPNPFRIFHINGADCSMLEIKMG